MEGYVRCRAVLVVASSSGLQLANKFSLDLGAADGFHHGKMFQVVVGLEECITSVELDENAAYAPYIARVAPSEVENDFRRTVVSG